MKVAVTGSEGFIGTELCRQLEAKGYEIQRIDPVLATDELSAVGQDARTVTLDNDVQGVFHLGAVSRIQPSFNNPVEAVDCNVRGTLRILEEARRLKVKVVYAGSSTADGKYLTNPYATTKYLGEELCRMYEAVYEVAVAIARFYNVFSLEPSHRNGVVGIFAAQTLNQQPLTITGDGGQSRDFIHVEDICSALVNIYESSVTGTFNVGTEKSYRIREVAEAFGGEITYLPALQGEDRATLADCKRLKKLGWEPKHNVIRDIEIFKAKFKINHPAQTPTYQQEMEAALQVFKSRIVGFAETFSVILRFHDDPNIPPAEKMRFVNEIERIQIEQSFIELEKQGMFSRGGPKGCCGQDQGPVGDVGPIGCIGEVGYDKLDEFTGV